MRRGNGRDKRSPGARAPCVGALLPTGADLTVFRLRTRSLSSPSSIRPSKRLTSALALLILVLVGGGIAFLATTDLSPPLKTLEKVIPDERFPR